MSHGTEPFAKTLKAARKGKGLSQRALSEKSGVPQAHISKIEKGTVDLRLSSLIALARVVDLEPTLVPRKAMPAIQSIVRSSEPAAGPPPSGDALRELRRLQQTIAGIPAAVQIPTEMAQIGRQVRELQNFRLSASQIETLKEVNKTVQAFREHTKGLEELRQALSRIQHLRNELAHAHASTSRIEPVRPAYSLDDEEGGDA